jgi:hypothetical protein
MHKPMRRVAIAIALAVLALLTPFVGAAAFIAALAGLTVALLLTAARRLRRRGTSRAPWVVSLAVSAVVELPQVLLQRWSERHSAVAVAVVCVLYVLILAAVLRFVIFLADYFRRPRPRQARQARP